MRLIFIIACPVFNSGLIAVAYSNFPGSTHNNVFIFLSIINYKNELHSTQKNAPVLLEKMKQNNHSLWPAFSHKMQPLNIPASQNQIVFGLYQKHLPQH